MSRTAILALSALAFAAGCRRETAAPAESLPLAVSVTALRKSTPMRETMRVQGALRAKDSAAVSARVPGTIDSIEVEEGASVKAGTVLFRIDQENLRNSVRVAEDDLAIARARKTEAEATLDKATRDRERLERLLASGAVTKDACEKAELQHKIASAALQGVTALITKAAAGLSVAKKNLADSVILAPFDGTLTRKMKNAGDYAGPGTPVFYMESAAAYEISCQLSSDRYADVKVAGTSLVAKNPASLAGKSFPITYKAAAVNRVSRTYEVRAAVPYSPDMVSGMIIDCEIVTRSFEAATVPVSALAFRGGKWVVYAVENGRAVEIGVDRGHECGGRVEVKNPSALEGKSLVAEGILLLNPGDAVRAE